MPVRIVVGNFFQLQLGTIRIGWGSCEEGTMRHGYGFAEGISSG